MSIQKIISSLRNEAVKELEIRLANADRLLLRDSTHEDAARLKIAIEDELVRRRKGRHRKRVGPLWWEPHDSNSSKFFAYETEVSATPVATIFKLDTHTASRKEVYSVRVGQHQLPQRFSEVEKARQAGSEAWASRAKPD